MTVVYDMILAALLCGVVLYLHQDWYDLCIENLTTILQFLDNPINCYEIYYRAQEEKNAYSKRVLASAALVTTNHIIALWYVTYRVIRCFQVDSGEAFMLNWGIAILASIAAIVILIISDMLFYRACRKFANT